MLKKFFLIIFFLGIFSTTFLVADDEFNPQFRSNLRPVTALQIQRAKEEGIDVSDFLHEIAITQPILPQPKPTNVDPQRPSFISKPSRPVSRPNSQDTFRNIEEGDLRTFIIPEDLQGLKLLDNLDDYTRYEDQTMDFNNVAENDALSNVRAINFSLSPISGVNMVITNGAVLVQGSDDIEIKKDFHVINVIGKENRFQVTKKITVDGDGIDSGLFLAEGAELIFEFINDGSTVPEVYFKPNFLMNLPKNAILRFEGEGVVTFGDASRINLNGDRTANPKEIVTFANKPVIRITTRSIVTVETGGKANISGIGTVEITNGASIVIDDAGQLVLGENLATAFNNGYKYTELNIPNETTGVYYDLADVKRMYFVNSSSAMLDIKIKDSGLIELSNSGILSVGYLKSTLEFIQGGMLAIRNGGKFEINLDDSNVAEGLLSVFHFGPGSKLAIDETGKLSMAANYYNSLMSDASGHTLEFFVDWTAKDAASQGDGLVGFIDRTGSNNRSFTGKFIPSNAIYRNSDEQIELLAEKLVNTNSGLAVTIVYTDENNFSKFRTMNGVSVQIQSGYTVISDNATTGAVTLKNSAGKTLKYDANGNQI
ncbi:MAG: hypothetical protein ABIA74_02395 [bacterium]